MEELKTIPMKKFLLVFTIFAAVLSMTSFQSGYGSGSGNGVTGAPGESGATCGRAGCHASGAFSPSVSVTLTDSDGESVSEYIPDMTYTVSLKINTTGLPGGYGFQMVCLDDTEEMPVNTFSDFPQDVGETTINGRQYVEQFRRLPVDSIAMTWTAPSASTGAVTFYAVGNAVNSNGGPQGDGVATGSFTFTEGEESSTSDIQDLELGVFPNPTEDYLNVPNTIQVATMEVMSMDGKLQRTAVSNQVNISDLVSGTYLVSVIDRGNKQYRQIIQKR